MTDTKPARSEEQLGSIEAIRKRLRQKLASGELQHGKAIGVKTLIQGDDLDWDSILKTLCSYEGGTVTTNPIASGLPAMIPFPYYLVYERSLDDLVVFYDYDAGITEISDKIKTDVQEGLRSRTRRLRSGKHGITTTSVSLLPPDAFEKLLGLLDGYEVPRKSGRPIDQLKWNPQKHWFDIAPIR